MSRARFLVVTVATALTMAATASLGLWQLDRARQKTALQAAILSRAELPAWDNAALLAQTDPSAGLYRPVRLRGQWIARHNVFLDNRQMDGRVGFFLVTPLRLSGSERVVLVQRGWVPRDFHDRARVPDVDTPAGEVTVQGRLAPPPGRLYQFGEAGTGAIRQNIDPAAYRLETGLALLDPSVQQTGDDEGPLRRQWPLPAVDVSKHHGYAFQWFALCTLVAGLYLWFQIIQPRRQRARLHGQDAR
ncbi:MAG: SURF1 family protein [Comamonadaceae bacterium]|jgi:surfeit locus 1 family protein|uniref:SURF1 family protein n=1 Tax=Hydrogenophaga sp. SNF1 TaxID=3098762 RepID=UPI002ACBFF83|nr:SURF1 family protein [Hydrogenophaga sp. SNF1]NCT97116.1 SURF1 family protein [Comamonadaceae bacterium]WQB82663.1 SURF1 family protein [Hydrogenophaga sp. SNF1]